MDRDREVCGRCGGDGVLQRAGLDDSSGRSEQREGVEVCDGCHGAGTRAAELAVERRRRRRAADLAQQVDLLGSF